MSDFPRLADAGLARYPLLLVRRSVFPTSSSPFWYEGDAGAFSTELWTASTSCLLPYLLEDGVGGLNTANIDIIIVLPELRVESEYMQEIASS